MLLITFLLIPFIKSELCKPGYGIPESGTTCQPCPLGSYSFGGENAKCIFCSNLPECENKDSTDCPYYTDSEGSTLCSYCPTGYYVNVLHSGCYGCSDHCLECSGGFELGECNLCEAGYVKTENGACQLPEENGDENGIENNQNGENTENNEIDGNNEFDENQQNGVNNENSIKYCISTTETSCTECYKPYIARNGICEPCEDGFHYDNGNCEANEYGCSVQIGNECFSCSEGFVMYEKHCNIVSNCSVISMTSCELCDNEDYMALNGICTDNDNCKYTLNDFCLECDNLHHVNDDNKCVDFDYCEKSFGESCIRSITSKKVSIEDQSVVDCVNSDVCVSYFNDDNANNQFDLKCKNDFTLKKGSTVCEKQNECDVIDSASTTDCLSCIDGYYLKEGTCTPNIKTCSTEMSEDFCLVCNDDQVMLNGECVSKTDYLTQRKCKSISSSKCTECEQYHHLQGSTCVDIEDNDCMHYSFNRQKCLECSEETLLDGKCTAEIDPQGINEDVTGLKEETIDDHCEVRSRRGCFRCDAGYYLLDFQCHQCTVSNCTSCDVNNVCLKCQTGAAINREKNTCEVFVSTTDGICKQAMPSGGCAICNTGYFRKEKVCEKCHSSCLSCLKDDECTECQDGYFSNSQTRHNDSLCHDFSLLVGCSKKTKQGCQECEDGYYLEGGDYCEECPVGCSECTSSSVCTSCDSEYIHKSSSCVHYLDISHCTKGGENKCTECEKDYEPSNDGSSCVPVGKNMGITVGLPIGVVVAVVLICVIVACIIVYYAMKFSAKKKQQALVHTFYMSKTDIDFIELDAGIMTTKEIIDFNDETVELPVNEPFTTKVCLGNASGSKVKLQFSVKEQNEKYDIQCHPHIIHLKKDQACEFEIECTAFCTCSVQDEIVLTVLNLGTGEETQIPIVCKFETMITTILDPDELVDEKKLGEGSFGVVFLGTFRGNKVAIKKMKTAAESEETLAEFEKEVSMLDKFRCDYIIHFYGAVFIPSKICMVTEFAEHGSLNDVLLKKRNEPPEMKMRTKILLDAARGMKYLHDNGILHRDIKPDNILVVSLNENTKVHGKLTDFGSSRNVNLLMTNMTFTKGIGTPSYMAPEVLGEKKYKRAADIFSFAVTMYEAFAWEEAYPKLLFKFPWKIAEFISNGERRPKQDTISDEQYELIENCWKQDPTERMQLPEIIKTLGLMYDPNWKEDELIENEKEEEKEKKEGEENEDDESSASSDSSEMDDDSDEESSSSTASFKSENSENEIKIEPASTQLENENKEIELSSEEGENKQTLLKQEDKQEEEEEQEKVEEKKSSSSSEMASSSTSEEENNANAIEEDEKNEEETSTSSDEKEQELIANKSSSSSSSSASSSESDDE